MAQTLNANESSNNDAVQILNFLLGTSIDVVSLVTDIPDISELSAWGAAAEVLAYGTGDYLTPSPLDIAMSAVNSTLLMTSAAGQEELKKLGPNWADGSKQPVPSLVADPNKGQELSIEVQLSSVPTSYQKAILPACLSEELYNADLGFVDLSGPEAAPVGTSAVPVQNYTIGELMAGGYPFNNKFLSNAKPVIDGDVIDYQGNVIDNSVNCQQPGTPPIIEDITPSSGGTVSLDNSVTLDIPPGAMGTSSSTQVPVEILGQSSSSAPSPPEGYAIIGAYVFTVNGQDQYTFNSPVTLTFTFDPSKVPPDTTPAVYYYDGTKWVLLTGTEACEMNSTNDIITVMVDHFTEYAVMAQPQTAAAPSTVALKDIAGNWAQANIENLVARGAITGYPHGTFRPNNDITRAEFVTVLVKALKLTPKAGPVFADTQGSWAKEYISTAAAYGIVSGYDAAHFGPNDPITREQMASTIVRADKLALVSTPLSFKDEAEISPWARVYVETAVKDGIFHGYPGGTSKPLGYATRAEAVTVIARILK